jgi:hypothetical protein
LRHANGCVVLQIPAGRQKNGRDQTIPTIPAFAAPLEETPEVQRTGFVFSPARERGEGRYADVKRVGRIITAIGREAGVTVNANGKPASAHDLRRSFGQRLADAGVPMRELQSIMRHARFETTEKYYLKHNAADQAKRLADRLVGYTSADRTQLSGECESSQVIGRKEGGRGDLNPRPLDPQNTFPPPLSALGTPIVETAYDESEALCKACKS